MAGYTHTCAACDAKLKIHERYVGRALHCPHCGTEFLADPTLVDVDDLAEELEPDRRRRVPWAVLATAAVVLGALAWWLGQAHTSGWLGELFRPQRSAGQVAILAFEGWERVPAAMDRETAVFIGGALEDPDPGSLDALRVQGRIVDVAVGTQVTIVEWVRRDHIARVRILSGQWTGRVVWVATLSVR
jgi:DNA-directed RNA polymerase subunit RPC12/RpoP